MDENAEIEYSITEGDGYDMFGITTDKDTQEGIITVKKVHILTHLIPVSETPVKLLSSMYLFLIFSAMYVLLISILSVKNLYICEVSFMQAIGILPLRPPLLNRCTNFGGPERVNYLRRGYN